MADPYFSELKYYGNRNDDFIEVVVDGGTDVSLITVTVYNSNGSVKSSKALGTEVNTIAGKDVYVINSDGSDFNGLNKYGAVSVETNGTVHQFLSFDHGSTVTATAGAAYGLESRIIGQTGSGESLETINQGATYITKTEPNSGIIPCFVRGTHIETSTGAKKVEDLRAGDLVKTQNGGLVTAHLILSTNVSARRLSLNPKLRPICITAGCLGLGLPARDLYLSPQHRVLVTSPIVQRMFGELDALVAATKLTALPGIYQVQDCDEVEYFHIITQRHEILISDGVFSESFLVGPQTAFILTPEQLCEVSTLFPNASETYTHQVPACFIPCGKHQKKLVLRHAKNNRSIVSF